jgi:hypothetical protein
MRIWGKLETVFFIVVLLILSSCPQGKPVHISLEQTPVISGGLGWGLVSLAYVRIMAEPSFGAADSGAIRKGELARITARARSYETRDNGVWYKLEIDERAGWVHESAMVVYTSRAEADRAAGSGR